MACSCSFPFHLLFVHHVSIQCYISLSCPKASSLSETRSLYFRQDSHSEQNWRQCAKLFDFSSKSVTLSIMLAPPKTHFPWQSLQQGHSPSVASPLWTLPLVFTGALGQAVSTTQPRLLLCVSPLHSSDPQLNSSSPAKLLTPYIRSTCSTMIALLTELLYVE